MPQLAGDAQRPIARRGPAAHRGMACIGAGVATWRLSDDPAVLRVGQCRAALPGGAGPEWQRRELLQPLGDGIKLSEAVLPGLRRARILREERAYFSRGIVARRFGAQTPREVA